MRKALLISSLLLLTLSARENPFFPSVGEVDIPLTSNENREKEPLKRAAITLPAHARLLQKVTIEYKNLDGSLESKSIELDNAVDWHLPIFISQSYSETPTLKVPEVKKVFKKKSVDKKQVESKPKYKEFASIKYVKFSSLGRNLSIETKDEIIRDFLLVNPHRIVVDFKRDTDMKSYAKESPKEIFKSVRIGSHSGYYRAVIELDGHYRYSLKKVSNGYMIELR